MINEKTTMKEKITYCFLQGSLDPVGERNKNIILRIETGLTVICFCLVAGRKQFSEQQCIQTGRINHQETSHRGVNQKTKGHGASNLCTTELHMQQ